MSRTLSEDFEGGWGAWMPASLLGDHALTRTEKHLLAWIEYSGGNDEGCDVDVAELADRIERSEVYTWRLVRNLGRKGYLRMDRGGTFFLTRYDRRPEEYARVAVVAGEEAEP